MTAVRLIPLPLHGALEMLVGFALMAAPVALGLSVAPAVFGVVVGVVLVGLALSSTEVEAEGRQALPVAAHHAFDYALVIGLLGSAVVFGATDHRQAAVLFTGAAVLQLALNLTTKYSRR